MSSNLVSLSPEIKLFLIDKGIGAGESFNFERFSEKAPARAIMINAGTLAGELPFEIPIDAQRVEIAVRDRHPQDALTLVLEIANIIHGATPARLHPTSDLDLLGAFIDERPQRTDNDDLDLPEQTLFAVFRVKKRS